MKATARLLLTACLLAISLPAAAQDSRREKPDIDIGREIKNPAMRWATAVEGSEMTFTGRDGTLPITTFNVRAWFDPKRLNDSKIAFVADITSAFIPAREREVALGVIEHMDNQGQVQKDGPGVLYFVSDTIVRRDKNTFAMIGNLTLHGKKQAMDIPFTATVDKDSAGRTKIVFQGAFDLHIINFGGPLPRSDDSKVRINFTFSEIPA